MKTSSKIVIAAAAVGAWWLAKKKSAISGIGGANDHLLPTVSEYSRYLDIAQNKFGISREQARKRYGQYTIGQWKKLLGIGAIDRDAVREILLWFENDRDLYDRFNVPIANMLVKKMRKGVQLDLETLAKSSMIDNVVRETLRSYWRSFGSFHVDPETRKAMKHEIAQSILIYAQDQFDYENENA